MTQKTVLITGAGSGIGYQTTCDLLKKDYRVFAHFHSNNSDLLKTQKSFPENLHLFQANFSTENALESLFQLLPDKNIDILINNAAILSPCSFNEMTITDFETTLRVNLTTPYFLIQKLLPHMIQKNWGRIINISSIGVKFGGSPHSSHYSISKRGLEGLAKFISQQYAKNNILCNNLRVGVTNTQIHQKISQKNMKTRVAKIPIKRMAEPYEISQFIQFLISDNCTYTSGQTIPISGGE